MKRQKMVRISAVIEPQHRAYIDARKDQPGYSFGEVLRELLDEAIEARRVLAEALGEKDEVRV